MIERRKYLFITMLASLALTFGAVSVSRAAAPKVTKLGFHLTQSAGQSADLKTIVEEMLKILKEREGLNLELVLFKDASEVAPALKSGSLDVLFTTDPYLFYQTAKKNGYIPFVTSAVEGRSQWNDCLIAPASSTAKTIEDIRGKNALTYGPKGEYYNLRSLLGEDPAKFFGTLRSSPNGLSMIYAMALGQADAAFVSEMNFDYLKATNPGPLKKIKIIECGKPGAKPLVMRSPKLSKEIAASLEKNLTNAHKDKDLKKFGPMFRMTKLSYKKADPKDFEHMFSVYEEYDKKGYSKDYEAWVKLSAK